MGFLSNYIDKKINNSLSNKIRETDFKNTKGKQNNVQKLKDFIVKTVGYINMKGVSRDSYNPAEYDFEEIKRASESDSYIKLSFEKYSRLIFKAGFYIKGENEEAVRYLNTRLRIMSFATKKPMDILYQEIADDLIRYSNSILIKTRVDKVIDGMKLNGIGGLKPVGGYFRVEPSSIYIKRDEAGNILQYIQRVDSGKEKKFSVEDVIHIYMDKESDNSFGTPKIIAALEDVKILRRLEGNVLSIVHRFAMPIFHWKIGLPQTGFQATDKEIDETKNEIENMALDGVVITNEKTDIRALGAEGNVIDVNGYLQYFDQRVIAALDLSASQIGRGGAKQDADSMEAQSHDYVKHVQKTISVFIENHILSELLLENGYNPILNESDNVSFVFNEINLDTKIKVENHELLKYQSNLQTLEEARRNIGYKEEVEDSLLYKNRIEVAAQIEIGKATSDVQGEWAMKLAKINAANKPETSSSNSNSNKKSSPLGNKTNGKKPSQSPNKDATTRNRPTNQNGTTSVKIKESEITLNEEIIRNKAKHKKKYKDIYSRLNKLKDNITNTDTDLDYLFAITKDSIILDISNILVESSQEGRDEVLSQYKTSNNDITNKIKITNINLDLFEKMANSMVKSLFIDIKKRIKNDRSYDNVDLVFSTLEYRLRFFLEHIPSKTKWYTFAILCSAIDIKKVNVDFGDSSDKDKYKDIVDTTKFNIDEIPAFHPFCDCKLRL